MSQSTIYNNAKLAAFKKLLDLSSDTIKVALVNSTYAALSLATIQGHSHYSDISGDEITGSGYTAGGKAIATTLALSGTALKLTIADNGSGGSGSNRYVSWAASLTASGAVVYDSTAGSGTLLFYVDFGSSRVGASSFKVDWGNVSGLIFDF